MELEIHSSAMLTLKILDLGGCYEGSIEKCSCLFFAVVFCVFPVLTGGLHRTADRKHLFPSASICWNSRIDPGFYILHRSDRTGYQCVAGFQTGFHIPEGQLNIL